MSPTIHHKYKYFHSTVQRAKHRRQKFHFCRLPFDVTSSLISLITRREWTSTDQEGGPCEQSCTPRRARHPVTCPCVTARCTCWQGRSLTAGCGLEAANGGQSGLLSRANSALESDVFTARIACARLVCVLEVTAIKCLRAARRWNGGPQWKKVARDENPIAWGTGAATHAGGGYQMTTKSASRKSRDTLPSE